MKRLRKVPNVLFEFFLRFAPIPKVLNFYALLVYQTSYPYKRSNLCPKLTYEGVETITEDSGKSGHNE